MHVGRYQNSVCKRGWLHKWIQTQETHTGVVERCTRCGKRMHFHAHKGANNYYLSYHIRDVLRKNDPMFKREYPHIHD